MKKTLFAVAALLPALAFAGNAKVHPMNSKHVAKAETMKPVEYTLAGVNETNSKEIEKIATDSGADKVFIDAKTGKVSITSKKFNATKFTTELSKVQGVSITK